jgi:hypothetical protein
MGLSHIVGKSPNITRNALEFKPSMETFLCQQCQTSTFHLKFLYRNLILILDLMDYPDSEEDGTMTTDGVAMLDDDDTENGEGSTSTPAATGDGGAAQGALAKIHQSSPGSRPVKNAPVRVRVS